MDPSTIGRSPHFMHTSFIPLQAYSILTISSPICKDIPKLQVCLKKGHFQKCPKHPGSYFAAREECPKCKNQERRDEKERLAEAKKMWAENEARRKAEAEEARVREVNEKKLADLAAKERRVAERQAMKGSGSGSGPGQDSDKGRRTDKDDGNDQNPSSGDGDGSSAGDTEQAA